MTEENSNKPPVTIKKSTSKKTSIHDNIEETINPKKVETDNTISFDALSKLLSTNDASGFYDITIPSLGKTYSFKQLTVGQQRSISKNSEDFKDRELQTKIRLGIIKQICLDKDIDPEKFTWPEFVYTLAQIRDNNFTDDIAFTLTCHNKDDEGNECLGKFDYTVDLGSIIKKLETVITEAININKSYSFEMNGHNIEFILNYPITKKYLDMINYGSKFKTKVNDKLEDAEDLSLSAFAYSYIRQIKFDDKPVEGSMYNNIEALSKFIDSTFKFDFNDYLIKLDENFKQYIDVLNITTTCPKCGKEVKFSLDIDDFFIRS